MKPSIPPAAELVADLDSFYRELLAEARQKDAKVAEGEAAEPADPEFAPLGFVDRCKVFDLGLKWVQTRNRLETEDDSDAFGKLADKFHGRGAGRKASDAPAGADDAGDRTPRTRRSRANGSATNINSDGTPIR